MNWKSPIPVGREPTGVVRRDANPFVSLQQEVERLFDDFARGFPAFGYASLSPSMDVTETDKEIELTAELAADAGLTVDEPGFRELLEEQRARARAASGPIRRAACGGATGTPGRSACTTRP